jgi:hypothetical protein
MNLSPRSRLTFVTIISSVSPSGCSVQNITPLSTNLAFSGKSRRKASNILRYVVFWLFLRKIENQISTSSTMFRSIFPLGEGSENHACTSCDVQDFETKFLLTHGNKKVEPFNYLIHSTNKNLITSPTQEDRHGTKYSIT